MPHIGLGAKPESVKKGKDVEGWKAIMNPKPFMIGFQSKKITFQKYKIIPACVQHPFSFSWNCLFNDKLFFAN